MQKIKFNNSENIYNVSIQLFNIDGNIKRYYLKFNSSTQIDESVFSYGFVELNEHNLMIQADFSDMKYIYKKESDTSYILTNTEGDIYMELPDPKPIPEPEPYVPTEEELQILFESEKSDKISELSSNCQSAIYSGVDVGDKHYSYTIQDQTNLKNAINIAAQTSLAVPYHADNESCSLYTLTQLQEIYTAQQINLTKHQTYFNQMKKYITNTFTDRNMIKELQNIVYGHALTGTYLESYNFIIGQSILIMKTLSGLEETVQPSK